MHEVLRRIAAAIAAVAVIVAVPVAPRAQAVPAIDKRITYILPHWFGFLSASPQEVEHQVAQLRTRIGEGTRVRVGFTTYIYVVMSPVDPDNADAVPGALASTFADVDRAIARANANAIPICLSFITAVRASADGLQLTAQDEDRRNMQWHADQSLAGGWTTFSRYARKQDRIQEAYIRELGRGLARRMALYPETIVAASGDGEIELSHDKSVVVRPDLYAADGSDSQLADYSPFAIAEFRDWLRAGGLYAPDQPFAGEAYASSARYAGDAGLANLNADFGTTFGTWALKYFDWSLSDSSTADGRAIPAATYDSSGFITHPDGNASGFDPPRARNPNNAWRGVWDLFRQTMVHRHNIAFAKWITTSPDPESGAVVPADRWFSDQIPADYLFTNLTILPDPMGVAIAPGFRLDTSASPHWTADIAPYGSIGITAFNHFHGNGTYLRTLAAVAPHIAARGVRWGIFEWNPSTPVSTDPAIYELEMALVEKYRPSVLSPFVWGHEVPDYRLLDTPFETALKNYVIRRNNVRLTVSKATLYANTLTAGSARTPPQTVHVKGEPGESPTWNATSPAPFVTIVPSANGRSFTVELSPQAYAPGAQSATITITPTTPGYTAATVTLHVTATPQGTSAAPQGSFDTPAELQVVSGEVGITGWAVDDIGIRSIDIYRSPVAGDAPTPNGLVFLGTANQVEGARSDIHGSFGTTPMSERAGWGYMLLSNFLPNGGNGVFTLHALVTDVEGRTTTLGSRRIDCRNASAETPFGTIDTPGQGETVSGTIPNFGWVLSPRSCIPADGSTIDVFIDGVPVGHPSYGHYRGDIASLFPGLCNTGTPGGGGAVGVFMIDTTTLTNGVHTIAWVARDQNGKAAGLGSRYFTVANP